MARVLGRVRLYRASEESTSVERQREIIESWATINGHEVVAWAEDVDVSGSLSPFDAPALAPYLSERAGEWDILVAWKLDRIARTSIPMHRLFGWIIDNNKQLVCVNDNIDLSTWVGRMIAGVIAGVAEAELEAIRERARASHKKLKQSGRWAGGTPPYGYKPVKLDNGTWKLEIDPVGSKMFLWIVDEFLGGRSIHSIVTELNEKNVTTPLDLYRQTTGSKWRQSSLRTMLRSRNMLGWTMYNGQPVLDEQGKPVLKAPPLVDLDTFQRIQQKLDSAASTREYSSKTAPLLGVLLCWNCGARMHYQLNKHAACAYFCKEQCDGKRTMIRADQIEQLAYETFLADIGEHRVMERRTIKANSFTNEIAESRAAYEDLVKLVGITTNSESRSTLISQLETLDNRIQSLQEHATEQDSVLWDSKGYTYREQWETLDTEGRRQLMLKAGYTVKAKRLALASRHHPFQTLEVSFNFPEDLKERLGIQS